MSARARHALRSKRESSLMIGGLVLLAGLGMYSLPYVIVKGKQGQNTLSKEGPLSVTEVRRGAFLNSGSKDIGPDPDWNFETNSYQGRRTAYPQRPQPPQETS
ncbi:hypothetical protein H310_06506 [Aphanomyces invadans]|uniref:Uncharacterized protein n=1 Tax=Aphanomyces invadans TaxID=157072 RepID=A0A024U6E5_9STRA|nr:hypothetical protein H310_06506 [Aphanomyces invadans]ETW01981.1 hypothetical protein H310_06506 [Aphanomyces invadans]|eukprot:XP_008869829.1 hypothetical protein H310_06506 [Aphanomyces invadans]